MFERTKKSGIFQFVDGSFMCLAAAAPAHVFRIPRDSPSKVLVPVIRTCESAMPLEESGLEYWAMWGPSRMKSFYSLLVIAALGALTFSCGHGKASARPSTTTLSSSLNPAGAGEAVTLTATVTGPSGTPTGTVTFDFSGNPSMVVALSGGTAVFPWTFDNSGSISVTASYSGDSTFAPSTSAAFTQTVDPDVVTIAGSPQQPLTQDDSGNYVAVVTITNTGDVTIGTLQVSISGTTLGSGSLVLAPAAVTNLAPGASTTVTLSFPSDSVPSGAGTAPLSLSGTYSTSIGSLSGNWGLTFRSVSL